MKFAKLSKIVFWNGKLVGGRRLISDSADVFPIESVSFISVGKEGPFVVNVQHIQFNNKLEKLLILLRDGLLREALIVVDRLLEVRCFKGIFSDLVGFNGSFISVLPEKNFLDFSTPKVAFDLELLMVDEKEDIIIYIILFYLSFFLFFFFLF
jgi:hypothetical protein